AMHGTARQVHLSGQRAHGPAALKLRLLADAVLYPLPDLRPVLGRTTGARGVLQSFQTLGSEAPSPLADRDLRQAQVRGDLLVGLAPSSGQHNTAAQRQTLRRGRSFHPSLQLLLLHGIEGNARGDSKHAPTVTGTGHIIKNYSYDVLVRKRLSPADPKCSVPRSQAHPKSAGPEFEKGLRGRDDRLA